MNLLVMMDSLRYRSEETVAINLTDRNIKHDQQKICNISTFPRVNARTIRARNCAIINRFNFAVTHRVIDFHAHVRTREKLLTAIIALSCKSVLQTMMKSVQVTTAVFVALLCGVRGTLTLPILFV